MAERSCRWGEAACVPCSAGYHGNTPHPQPAPATMRSSPLSFLTSPLLPTLSHRQTRDQSVTCTGVSAFAPTSPRSCRLASSLSRLSSISSSCASLLLSSRCFMRTATTTLTSTNWAVRTKVTKYMGEINGR